MSSPELNVVLAIIAATVAAYFAAVCVIERRAFSADTILHGADRLSTFVGKSAGWLILILTFAVVYEVFMRYALRAPTEWAFDASYILYGALFMLAGPYALARNAHVRGDFLYREWPPRRQAAMDLVLYVLFFFPGILAFAYAGYSFASFSWIIKEHSSNSPNGPPLYHFKSLIPIVGGLMIVQGVAEVTRCLICLRTGVWPQRLHDVEETERVILEQAAQVQSAQAQSSAAKGSA